MLASFQRWLLPATFCTLAFSAMAQPPASQQRKADPLDADASVPALAYESVFNRYRRAGDDKAIGWREANDTVLRIGGWRTYAREAHQPEPAAAPAPSESKAKPMPMPAAHGGHKMP